MNMIARDIMVEIYREDSNCCIAMHACIALHCIALHCIALHCIELHALK